MEPHKVNWLLLSNYTHTPNLSTVKLFNNIIKHYTKYNTVYLKAFMMLYKFRQIYPMYMYTVLKYRIADDCIMYDSIAFCSTRYAAVNMWTFS